MLNISFYFACLMLCWMTKEILNVESVSAFRAKIFVLINTISQSEHNFMRIVLKRLIGFDCQFLFSEASGAAQLLTMIHEEYCSTRMNFMFLAVIPHMLMRMTHVVIAVISSCWDKITVKKGLVENDLITLCSAFRSALILLLVGPRCALYWLTHGM